MSLAPAKRPAIDLELQEDFFEKFNLIEGPLLGKGLSGFVVLATNSNDLKDQTAVKKFHLHGPNASEKEADTDQHTLKKFLNEVKVMTRAMHPNIMPLIASVRTPEYLALVMPYCNHGTLMQSIKSLTIGQQVKYIQQLCMIVDFLHNINIVHGDIKPQNVLLDGNKDLLLADFGFSKIVPNKNVEIFIDFGTKAYRAPETYNDERVNPFKVDMYALGVTLWAILLRKRPFRWMKYSNSLPLIPKKYRELVTQLLDSDPAKRPTVSEVHNIIRQLS